MIVEWRIPSEIISFKKKNEIDILLKTLFPLEIDGRIEISVDDWLRISVDTDYCIEDINFDFDGTIDEIIPIVKEVIWRTWAKSVYPDEAQRISLQIFKLINKQPLNSIQIEGYLASSDFTINGREYKQAIVLQDDRRKSRIPVSVPGEWNTVTLDNQFFLVEIPDGCTLKIPTAEDWLNMEISKSTMRDRQNYKHLIGYTVKDISSEEIVLMNGIEEVVIRSSIVSAR